MSRTPRWTDAQLDEAEAIRAKGEKWIVVEAMMGEGIKGACDYRRLRLAAPKMCDCNQGRLPCSCKPDAWLIKGDAEARAALTEHEANAALCEMPGATKHALFMRESK